MKFGETLNRRSVLAWRTYNIDYAQAKRFIKDHTTPGNGKAVSIPGQGSRLEHHFEEELFQLLHSECSRITLFVRSKQYEIDSRLNSVERTLDQAERRAPVTAAHLQKSLRFRQRLSKIESDILNVGEEVQKLSRFTKINRTAVRKLTKKYKKWSGSATLGPRVEADILGQPKYFSETQLKHALDRYTDLIDRVRMPFSHASPKKSTTLPPLAIDPVNAASKTAIIRELNGDAKTFDTALDVCPAEPDVRRAVFWIHRDNVMELKVLLLQHMHRTYHGSSSPLKRKDSSNSLRRKMSSSGEGDLVVSLISNGMTAISAGGTDLSWAPKALFRLYGQVEPLPAVAEDNHESSASNLDNDDSDVDLLQSQLSRLSQSKEDKRIAQSNYKRSRFCGLQNTVDAGVWAGLDEDIHFSSLSDGPIASTPAWDIVGRLPHLEQGQFPHAVLTAISIGDNTGLIGILEKSHLTESIQNFTVEAHALASLFQEDADFQPSWVSFLDKDIRHVPSEQTPPNDRHQRSGLNDSRGSSTLQGTAQDSLQSAGSKADSPANSVGFVAARRPREKAKIDQQSEQRYWNEFDFPEDDEEGFAVYIDPDAPVFPGQKMFLRWWDKTKSLFTSPRPRRLSQRSSSSSLNSTSSSDGNPDDEPNVRISASDRLLLFSRRNDYNTLPLYQRPEAVLAVQRHSAQLYSPNSSTLCLLAACCLLLVCTIMSATSRRKLKGEVDIVVIVGVLASLLFAIIAAVRLWGIERIQREEYDLIENYGFHSDDGGWAKWVNKMCRTAEDVVKAVTFAAVVVWCGALGILVVM